LDTTLSREQLERWQQGQTGIPIVDAGMRELWHTGWMHNRVRMIVASLLTKNLGIHWLEGARWFWETLVDADLANNTLGWQWCAGCGADAAPYFRIFNPVRQGERFDPQGDYIRYWVAEIAALPDKKLNTPWEADKKTLTQAGIRLGQEYPMPIVDLMTTRQNALAKWDKIR
jgi:deoxyribodipyrimidine photo-lyase